MKNGVMFVRIFGLSILGIFYALFLILYTGFVPYSDAFTCLALFLALFSALIVKSKTEAFKVANILFFAFTLYQLISYKMDWDTFRRFSREECIDENDVLKDLKEKGIIGDLEYRYDDYEGKCLLKEVKEENGVVNG